MSESLESLTDVLESLEEKLQQWMENWGLAQLELEEVQAEKEALHKQLQVSEEEKKMLVADYQQLREEHKRWQLKIQQLLQRMQTIEA